MSRDKLQKGELVKKNEVTKQLMSKMEPSNKDNSAMLASKEAAGLETNYSMKCCLSLKTYLTLTKNMHTDISEQRHLLPNSVHEDPNPMDPTRMGTCMRLHMS